MPAGNSSALPNTNTYPSDQDPSLPPPPGGDAMLDDSTRAMDQPAAEEDEEEEEEEEEEVYESSSSPSTETDTLTWISWFCSLPGHEYFCEVAEDFIEDDFNLTGLAGLVPFYKEAMEMILDVEPEDDEAHRVPDVSIVESSAELLYGLIHQRYILTRQGLQQMCAKYESTHFGTCPRVYCSQAKLVPCGRSDLPGVDTVKLFCPSCLDMYVPPSSRFQGVDGAFFGTTFPHLLFQTYPPPSSLPAPSPAPANPAERELTTAQTSLSKVYQPRIYGFKVSERARSGPRMMWMRMRPRTEGEVDWDDSPLGVPGANEDGTGGSGEKGTLFDDERLEDEEEDDAEEEEEEGGAPGGGAAAGAAKEGGEVERVADKVRESMTLASSSSSKPSPQRTFAPATDGRAIKPLPRSSPNSPSASSAPPVRHSPSQPPASSTATSPSPNPTPSAASAALAASIQRHLSAAGGMSDVGLPRMPQRAAVAPVARGGARQAMRA
ncbi:hypothetical protein JCM11251_006732 [Rhodosporidiobolus azoricus]